MSAELPPPHACIPMRFEGEGPPPSGQETVEEVKPLQLVTFVWPDRNTGRTGICHMAYHKGWTVKMYLHAEPLRNHGILGMWKKSKAFNRRQERVKLGHVPMPGDAIVVTRVRR